MHEHEYELNPETKIETLKEKLSSLPGQIDESYQSLQADASGYVCEALSYTNSQNKELIVELLADFAPLRPAQLQDLFRASAHLGMPLSPIGLVSFVPGGLHRLKMFTETMINFGRAGHVRDSVGYALLSDELKPHRQAVGFWLAQSINAYSINVDLQLKEDYSQAQDEMLRGQGIDDPEAAKLRGTYKFEKVNQMLLDHLTGSKKFGKAAIRPDKRDVRMLHATVGHEAAHGAMQYLNPQLVNYETIEGRALSELLAFRINYISDPTSIDKTLSTFMGDYFSSFPTIPDTRIEVIKKLTKRIFRNKKDSQGQEVALSPAYQANISTISMIAGSASEFLELCTKVIDEGQVIPEIEQLKSVIYDVNMQVVDKLTPSNN